MVLVIGCFVAITIDHHRHGQTPSWSQSTAFLRHRHHGDLPGESGRHPPGLWSDAQITATGAWAADKGGSPAALASGSHGCEVNVCVLLRLIGLFGMIGSYLGLFRVISRDSVVCRGGSEPPIMQNKLLAASCSLRWTISSFCCRFLPLISHSPTSKSQMINH